MRKTVLLLLAAYYVMSFVIVNVSFPIRDIFAWFSYSHSYVLSSYLLLCLTVTVLTGIALPLSWWLKKPLWLRVTVATAVQLIFVSAFAIACSGAGFGWSVNGSTALMRLSFFFAEFQWLAFIFAAGLPLAASAAVVYYLTGRKLPYLPE